MTKLEDYLPLDGLGGTYSEEQARQAIANAEAAANINFGTKITDSTMPTGGVGNLGWLSAIWKLITDRLPTLISGKIPTTTEVTAVSDLQLVNDINNPLYVAPNSITFTETQLTAPGTTTARQLTKYRDVAWSVKVASINTSVTIRFEGSMNNVDWFNLEENNNDILLSSDGTSYYQRTNCNVEYVRFNFVSEIGGTAATINVITRLA